AAALPDRTHNKEVADRLRDTDAGRDRGGILPPFRELLALLECSDHRRTSFGLHRIHARPLRADEADRLQLVEPLPHADEACAAAGRIEDRIGQLPAELLGEL